MALKPVVFIPGFPASTLVSVTTRDTIFPPSFGDLFDSQEIAAAVELICDNPPGALEAGEPVREILDIAKQAQSLYDRLQAFGYTVDSGDNLAPVGWDWRKGVDDPVVQQKVTAAIARLRQANGGAKVIAIVHSTGGLVLRALLESQPALAGSIEHILALGVPWAGTLKSFRYLLKGERIGLGPLGLSAAQVRRVMRHAQAAYDLLPPDPARTDLTLESGTPLDLFVDGAGRPITPLLKRAWCQPADPEVDARSLAADARLGARASTIAVPTPPITNVVGWGGATEVQYRMNAAGAVGDPNIDKNGDTTVPAHSAAWLRGPAVRTFFLPIGAYPLSSIPHFHSRIWDSPPVDQFLDEILKDVAREPFVCASCDHDQVIESRTPLTIRLSAADENGRPLPGAKVELRRVPIVGAFSFGGGVRMNLEVPRTQWIANVGTNRVRFVAVVTWNGGTREVALLAHV